MSHYPHRTSPAALALWITAAALAAVLVTIYVTATSALEVAP